MRKLFTALLTFMAVAVGAQEYNANTYTVWDDELSVVIDHDLAKQLQLLDGGGTVGDILLGGADDWQLKGVGAEHQSLLASATTVVWGALNLGQAAAVTGVLGVTNGGTSLAAYTQGDILYSSSGGPTLTTISAGDDGNSLTMTSGLPSWGGVDLANGTHAVAGVLKLSNGGTGLANTYTAGDIVYYATGDLFTKVGIGAANTILKSTGSAPSWTATPEFTTLAVGALSHVEGDLYVAEGTAGGVAAHVKGDLAVFESNSDAGISILAPDNEFTSIYFGTPLATNSAGIIQVHGVSDDTTHFNFFVDGDKHWLRFRGVQDRIVVNEGSHDYDLRVESDNNQGILFTDAANDLVGINTTSPAAKLDIFNDDEAQPTLALGAESGGCMIQPSRFTSLISKPQRMTPLLSGHSRCPSIRIIL